MMKSIIRKRILRIQSTSILQQSPLLHPFMVCWYVIDHNSCARIPNTALIVTEDS